MVDSESAFGDGLRAGGGSQFGLGVCGNGSVDGETIGKVSVRDEFKQALEIEEVQHA